MTPESIISKVWSFCTTLRDDGVGYVERVSPDNQAQALIWRWRQAEFTRVDGTSTRELLSTRG